MSQKRFIRIGVLASILICGLLVGCGPSADEQAATSVALTATAATDTPTPTPTPTDTPTPTSTPVPYDLSLIVTGEEDAPIVGALVILVEDGESTDSQITDEVGQVFWYDIPGETVSLSMSAQGYFPEDVTDSLERGINQMTVSLERDPHGLLPSQACGPGEKLLYIEDFQDGEADRLELIKLKIGGWDLGPHPDSLGNIVAMYDGRQWSGLELSAGSYDNAVWRFQTMTDNRRIRGFGWLFNLYDEGEVEHSGYSARFEPGRLLVFRSKWPVSNPMLFERKNIFLSPRNWHQIEMSTFDGNFEFWLDGKRLLLYEDPEPLPGGTFQFSFGASPVVSVDYFDNISVCELTAPYVPMPTPES